MVCFNNLNKSLSNDLTKQNTIVSINYERINLLFPVAHLRIKGERGKFNYTHAINLQIELIPCINSYSISLNNELNNISVHKLRIEKSDQHEPSDFEVLDEKGKFFQVFQRALCMN